MTPSLYLHGINTIQGFGTSRLLKLYQHTKDPKAAFFASTKVLLAAGIEPESAKNFLEQREKIDLEKQQQILDSEGIKLLNIEEDNYPKLLREISKAPCLLYYKGTFSQPDELCIAVVGTRKISTYGRTVTPWLLEPLIEAGVTIVSGLAFGVDALSQQLAAKKGRRTIAIVGNGLDSKSLYPKEHQLLADEILASGGAIVSEYPPGTPPLKHHFIARNRILSGMCAASIIVECNLKSGSLITAQYAIEQNRQLFAVPGPIYAETSQGPNNLIKMGAKLITDAKDILQDLNLETLPQQEKAARLLGDNAIETEILKTLNFEPVNINELIKKLEFEASEVTSALTFLELKGRVRNLGGQQYILSR